MALKMGYAAPALAAAGFGKGPARTQKGWLGRLGGAIAARLVGAAAAAEASVRGRGHAAVRVYG